MKSCGVIAEYNPFHNGHQYHLYEARKKSQADCIVVLMSGNFVQRGEPAIFDKWSRAQAALENGADLVFELPSFYAVQAADYFAKGAIKLFHALGVDGLAFGTEQATTFDYAGFGKLLLTKQAESAELFQQYKNSGISYAQQMSNVYQKLWPDATIDWQAPNHLLALSYAKENAKYEKPMELISIPRKAAPYHQTEILDQTIASATAIRQLLLKQTENWQDVVKQVTVETTYQTAMKQNYSHWENLFPYLKYRLLTATVEELQAIYQMREGIEYRLLEKIVVSSSFDEFLTAVKTKRFTWTSLARLAVYILGNITKNEIQASFKQPYLRLLGTNQIGQKYLHDQKQKEQSIPIISRLNKQNRALATIDIKLGRIYRLQDASIPEQDFSRQPIILKE